jgi:hypothetical protein
MGTLHYGAGSTPIDIPDRLLAHLKVVITTKLRRGESFTASWINRSDDGPGRTTLWIQPAIQMQFEFDSADAEVLNAAYLKTLAEQANSNGGLSVDLDTHIEDAPASLHERRTASVAA